MKEKIIELLKNESFLDRTIELLAKALHQEGTNEYVEFIEIMNTLEETGVVIRNKYNQYCLPSQFGMVVGKLSINKKGFGFVIIDEESDDIFISKDSLKDAFNQDIVLVELIKGERGDHSEGRVVRVIKRGKTRIVGEIKQGKRDCFIQPDDPKFDKKVFIDGAHLHGAMPGHKVVVEIKSYKPSIKGNVVEILGHVTDPGVDILSVVSSHDTSIEFPEKVYRQIDSIEDSINEEDCIGRRDLRKETIVTIDGDDAKDLDDAISLEILKNGNYYLGVHIADVSNYVTENSALDKEAVGRGTSIYLVDRVIPMLPHKLSNGICSLNPHVDRLTISCFMEITKSGKVVNHEIVPAVIHSTERMTYNNVNKILDGDKEQTIIYQHVKDLFFRMQDLALVLRANRDIRGAIDFDVKESKVVVDERGKPIDVVLRTRGASDKIIEEFMLLANETVAEHFKWLDVPFIYRVHEHPKTKKLQQFSNIATTLGYTIKGSLEKVYPADLNAIIEASKDTPEHTIIATLLLRCMQKARYDEQCLGHFGLADEYYTHFTSPIRRYPDLLVHRLIRTYIFNEQMDTKTIQHFQEAVPVLAEQSSLRERVAITIEREVSDMKIAEYMEQHIGEEFDGIISSVTNFGFFVELDNTIDGLVHVTDLTDDFYFFDERNLQYIGQRTGKKYRMSDPIRVKVSGASKKEKSVDFEIVGIKSNKKTKKTVILNTYQKSGKKRHHKSEQASFNRKKKSSFKKKVK